MFHNVLCYTYRYVMSTLELLVVQEYMIVYFHSATSSRRKLPGIRWFKRCYDMIDRRCAYYSPAATSVGT